MDPLVAALLAMLRQEAVKIGADLIDRGVDLVDRRLRGQHTDGDVLAWLRDVQAGGAR